VAEPAFKVVSTATPGVCDAVYSYILASLTLSPAHAAQLLERGLDETTIARNLYATATSRDRMRDIATEAAKRFDVVGVPGFVWVRQNRWSLVAERGELLIPVRDSRSRTVALRRRANDAKRQRRYRWCSSEKTPSGSPVHHAEPWNSKFRPVLYVTEGELKADVISAKLGFTTIGLAGATNVPPGLGTTLREAYPGVASAFIAYDADFHRNPAVEKGRDGLIKSLQAAGYRVCLIEWDEANGKGLDDVLVRACA
jgi:hypothetical protein